MKIKELHETIYRKQFIFRENQWSGFYLMATLASDELRSNTMQKK